MYEEGGTVRTAPLDGDAALGLIQQILHVGTRARVYGNAATPRDVPDDVVAGNRIATLGAVDQQVPVALDDQRCIAKTKHALDGLDQGRFGVFGFLFDRLFGL